MSSARRKRRFWLGCPLAFHYVQCKILQRHEVLLEYPLRWDSYRQETMSNYRLPGRNPLSPWAPEIGKSVEVVRLSHSDDVSVGCQAILGLSSLATFVLLLAFWDPFSILLLAFTVVTIGLPGLCVNVRYWRSDNATRRLISRASIVTTILILAWLASAMFFGMVRRGSA